MASVCVERLDHLGVVASVIKDLGIVEMVDARLGRHDQEEISTGEAVAGMILNGLGFSDRPLTLTPQFFANKPLDLLGLDHGIGHLASMSPQEHERLTPSKD
jgi:transposase